MVPFAALMCHAPIVLPEVGGRDARECARTTRAMREVAARAVAAAPDRIVLVSPHSPRRHHEWSAWRGRHAGDLAAFGAPRVRVDLPDAPEVAEVLGLPAILSGEPLDHGAMVPLSFLWAAGWRGPTAILSLPWEDADARAVGEKLAALPGRTVVIASGDMSHRLQTDAPAGYHPRARDFDRAFVTALEQADWAAALGAPWREEAAEDVVESTAFAMGAAGAPRNPEVLSYEGPFGVGYTEAVLAEERPPLYAVARQAIRAALRRELYEPPPDDRPAAGVFVTLRKDGALRGCVGSIVPQSASLYEEIARMAPEAALADDRFPPVEAAELPDLQLEVSVLEPPEPVDDPATLDPAVWGVIVTSGWKRALLLPDIEGIDTVEQQLHAVRRKAGIRPDAPVRLERFRVRKEVQP